MGRTLNCIFDLFAGGKREKGELGGEKDDEDDLSVGSKQMILNIP